VKNFFSNETEGLATLFDSYLDKTVGEDGTLVNRQSNLTTQSTNIDQQITDMERIVQMEVQRMTASFTAMETAQQKINQQSSFLSQRFG
jgi:flagellar capping protein FliD